MDEELRMIRRKIGELYALMTRLPEFDEEELKEELSRTEQYRWETLVKACEDWINTHDR
jgi:hypothetical protein